MSYGLTRSPPRSFSPHMFGLPNYPPSELILENPSGTFRLIEHAVVVFTDGACPGNGTPMARGGYGVFFGENSTYNVSKPLKDNSRHTSQRAELTAAFVALNQIERIEADYNDFESTYIIATDSAYVVNSLTSYIYKWRQNGYTSSTGREVANRDLFERLDDKLDKMASGRRETDVYFWK